MTDYETAKVPPATPPAIDPRAKPLDAHELAQDDGDSEHDGSVDAAERREANAALEKRQAARMAADGAGEKELDSMTPETLLPPD